MEQELTWEEIKNLADVVLYNQYGTKLSDHEKTVLQGSWEGLTYEDIAKKNLRGLSYIKGNIGSQLWRKLSEALGEEVSKPNFRAAFERKASLERLQTVPRSLTFPEGSVPINSHFYIERERVESLCYEEIRKDYALIRIKSPKLMGKTSLVNRVLTKAKSENYHTVSINFRHATQGIITDLDTLLRFLCSTTEKELNLQSRINEYWDTTSFGSNQNCTAYFDEHILENIESPLVLALDNIDRLFPHGGVVEDFLGMLRSWHEQGKTSEKWAKVRLLIAHSTECYVPLDLNQSPFNIGIPIELIEFNYERVEKLSKLYNLNWHESQIKKLMQMIGGHPYLLGLALYKVACGEITLEKLLQEASWEVGIYNSHLREHWVNISKSEKLTQALKKVISSEVPVELDCMDIYKLDSIGIVRKEGNKVSPRCNLYREYFTRVMNL